MRIARYKNGHWAVFDSADELVCVTVYRRGSEEVVRRLTCQQCPAGIAATPVFVGYQAFEKWLEYVNPSKPVYVLSLGGRRTSDGGYTATGDIHTHCQQLDGAGTIHYCRLCTVNIPLYEDTQKRAKPPNGWNSLPSAIEALLLKKGLTVLPAAIAVPRDIQMLDGSADCIRFDRASNTYLVRSA